MNTKPESALLRAHGKLLLTGEYAVLDGALGLALPVRYGQTLAVAPDESGNLHWTSADESGETWFEATFALPDLNPLHTTGEHTAQRLRQILQACRTQNPSFLAGQSGWAVRTRTDFPRAWGLGTSSTLLAALARWAEVDPYRVLFDTFGGSGYDIACAFADGPLLYHLGGGTPRVERVHFAPPFAEQLLFVFLGKKQDSRAGIRRFRERVQNDSGLINAVSDLTRQCLLAQTLSDFCAILLEHERLIGRALDLPRAQDLYFSDFSGVVKSLGAWGGDFVLAAGAESDAVRYFREKGFGVCVPYGEMVL
ncbi:MAG: GHMP kinase [Lewinellaceae bacterium]|nr:GHMP kinase [Lewinellaceae bacterium]